MSNKLTLFLIGLISGFTLLISGNTLNYWLASININIKTIGIFALITLPYSINFIWAPIFDSIHIKFATKFLDNTTSWLVILQFFLVISVFILSYINPITQLPIFAIVAFMVAFFSSSQDCLLGVFKTKIINPSEQGNFAGIYILGYRIGMLLSGSFGIYLSNIFSFQTIYKIFATFILILSIILFFLTRNKFLLKNTIPETIDYKKFKQTIVSFFGNFKSLIIILLFLIFYRLPDNFLSIMTNPFLIKVGFNATQIATVGKLIGIIAAIIGGFIASHVMKTLSIITSLYIFAILHSLAHFLFIIQDVMGDNVVMLCVVILCENITAGMSMAAYITFITNLSIGEFSATKYSFYSAMMGFSRSVFPALSGYLVANLGWRMFFIIVIIMILPALYLLKLIKSHYLKYHD